MAFKKGQSGNLAGRPRGIPNKVTTELRQAILEVLEAAGGKDGAVGYLTKLAHSNSSAFCALLGRVLPSTIAGSEKDGKLGMRVTFRRELVYPDGRKVITQAESGQVMRLDTPLLPALSIADDDTDEVSRQTT